MRKTLITLAFCLAAAAFSFGQDPAMGTWKLNEAKSKLAAGGAKNHTVLYEKADDKVKVTVDGVDGSGKPVHSEWTGLYDGKDYPLTGDSSADTRAYKKVNDRTLMITNKKGGKVVSTAKAEVSADGKSRTVTAKGADASGKKIDSTQVYDKQ